MSAYDDSVNKKYTDMFSKFIGQDIKLNAIITTVVKNIVETELTYAYNGEYSDGGASYEAKCLLAFLDGINYVKTGVTTVYKKELREINNNQDSEYKKYLELKKKFE